jgi:hypothetical protein
VLAAGQAAAQYMPTAGADRDPHEVFYACPTATVEQLFKQVAAAAGAAGRQPGQAASDFEAVAQLSKALQARRPVHVADLCCVGLSALTSH